MSNKANVSGSNFKSIIQIIISPNAIFPLIIIIVLVVLYVVQSIHFSNKAPQTGDINISVGRFLLYANEKLRENDEYIGFSNLISEKLSRDLESRFIEGVVIDIRFPEELPSLRAPSIEEMSEKAIDYAKTVNADILLYGYVEETRYGLEIHPYLYVNESKFGDVIELLGEYELGSILYSKSSSMVLSDFDESSLISERITCLTDVIHPLSYYIFGDYENAIQGFLPLFNSDCSEVIPHDLLALLTGNAYVRDDQMEKAEYYYELALSVNRDYARAYLGLATVIHKEAYDSLVAGDIESTTYYLNEEAELLVQALSLGLDDESIQQKVDFSFGQMNLMKYWLSKDVRFIDFSLSYYDKVILAYEKGNHQNTEIVANAFGGKGLIYYYIGDYAKAFSFYQQAADLSKLADRKFIFTEKVCDIYRIKDLKEDAETCYEKLLLRYSDILSEEEINEIETHINISE